MNTTKFIAMLTEARKDTPHVVGQTQMEDAEWLKAGSPHVWAFQESRLVKGVLYRAWFDMGYGNVALTKGEDNTLIDTGKHTIVNDNVLLTDVSYYQTVGWLWHREP